MVQHLSRTRLQRTARLTTLDPIVGSITIINPDTVARTGASERKLLGGSGFDVNRSDHGARSVHAIRSVDAHLELYSRLQGIRGFIRNPGPRAWEGYRVRRDRAVRIGDENLLALRAVVPGAAAPA